jgi:hypothetical protein
MNELCNDVDIFITQSVFNQLESDENVDLLHDILFGEGKSVQPNDESSGFALLKRDREKTKGTDPNNF